MGIRLDKRMVKFLPSVSLLLGYLLVGSQADAKEVEQRSCSNTFIDVNADELTKAPEFSNQMFMENGVYRPREHARYSPFYEVGEQTGWLMEHIPSDSIFSQFGLKSKDVLLTSKTSQIGFSSNFGDIASGPMDVGSNVWASPLSIFSENFKDHSHLSFYFLRGEKCFSMLATIKGEVSKKSVTPTGAPIPELFSLNKSGLKRTYSKNQEREKLRILKLVRSKEPVERIVSKREIESALVRLPVFKSIEDLIPDFFNFYIENGVQVGWRVRRVLRGSVIETLQIQPGDTLISIIPPIPTGQGETGAFAWNQVVPSDLKRVAAFDLVMIIGGEYRLVRIKLK